MAMTAFPLVCLYVDPVASKRNALFGQSEGDESGVEKSEISLKITISPFMTFETKY